MRLIDADELTKDRVENDPVRIAAECAPTAFDKEKVINELLSASICSEPDEDSFVELEEAIEIIEKGGIE
ncbi:MAG TPA: hypothetical protein H9743_00440 [Candidatus Mediterraneibacter vanvlietii]|nr:hypothetical protein [Candidatus Mediterraneibacter vanvlietii]